MQEKVRVNALPILGIQMALKACLTWRHVASTRVWSLEAALSDVGLGFWALGLDLQLPAELLGGRFHLPQTVLHGTRKKSAAGYTY